MWPWKKKSKRLVIDCSKCDDCAHYKTANCPNSSKCFSLSSKPYFKAKKTEPAIPDKPINNPVKIAPGPDSSSKRYLSYKLNVDTSQMEKPSNHRKEFLAIFKKLTYRHRPWEVWKDFVTMFACAISNAVDQAQYEDRETLYLKTIKKYSKQEQALFPGLTAETVMALEQNSEQDFLGSIFMELDLGNDAQGQFFTPYSVCQCMAAIAIGDVASEITERGYVTIHDPCCGAGATLIAGIHEARKAVEKAGLNFQDHVLVIGQDVDPIVALMGYIQISLLGMAGYIKVGNTFTEPICSSDTLESYWFTPMYFSDIWFIRRLFRKTNLLFEE